MYLHFSILCAVMCHYSFLFVIGSALHCAVCHCACEECNYLYILPVLVSHLSQLHRYSISNHTECQADLITVDFIVLVRALFIHGIEIENNHRYENCTVRCQKLVMQKMDFMLQLHTGDYIMTQKVEIRKHKQGRPIWVTTFTQPSFILTPRRKEGVLGRLSFRVWC